MHMRTHYPHQGALTLIEVPPLSHAPAAAPIHNNTRSHSLVPSVVRLSSHVGQ